MTTEQAKLPEGIAELMETANENGLWFYSTYQQMWFSPSELTEEMQSGRFRWGPNNWKLRNPSLLITELVSEVNTVQKRLENAKRRIAEEEHK